MKINSIGGMGMANAAGLVAAGVMIAWLLAGCAKASTSDGGMMCGEGTMLIGRYCVPDDSMRAR